MGVLLDSIGAPSNTNARFTGTNLSRYNNAFVGSFSLGDAVGSKYAISDLPGLPLTSFDLANATFGRTGIKGAGTAMQALEASTIKGRAGSQWGPSEDGGMTISFWFQTSATPIADVYFFGWGDGTSTDRLYFGWDFGNLKFKFLDENTDRNVFTPATSWATDIADGNPHLMTARYRDGSFDFFIDSVQGDTVTVQMNAAPSKVPFAIFPNATIADGDFQHWYFWGVGLNTDAILDLYNSGSGRFSDGT